MLPEIVFLNHSSLLLRDQDTSIICDPWFKGTAFDNGWRLLAENSHDINQINFDYVWISHEHPDHFSIPTLRELTESRKFLFQQTGDEKVVKFLDAKGHKPIEINPYEDFKVGPMLCRMFPSDGYDSILYTRFSDGSTILNVNDARLESGFVLDRIKELGVDFDIVAIQFSYANWAGNKDDKNIPDFQHQEILARIELVKKELKPKKIILFASYVYCSHEDNFYWNEHFWLKDVLAKVSSNTTIQFIVPQPDQVISMSRDTDAENDEKNRKALAFWTDRHLRTQPRDFDAEHLSAQELKAVYEKFFEQLWMKNDLSFATNHKLNNFCLKVRVKDLKAIFSLGLFQNSFVETKGDEYDVEVSSRNLKLLLEKPFGRGTLTINSKIQFNYPTAHRYFIFFFIYYFNNIGRFFSATDLCWKKLESIERVAVLQSIFRFHPDALDNYRADFALLNSID